MPLSLELLKRETLYNLLCLLYHPPDNLPYWKDYPQIFELFVFVHWEHSASETKELEYLVEFLTGKAWLK